MNLIIKKFNFYKMHKITFRFQQKESPHGYMETRLTHIGLRDENNKFVKFLKHDPDLMQILEDHELELDLTRYLEHNI